MIDILMATYNGEKYLKEQIESILQQSYMEWRLIIADDCSSDSTVKILEYYHSLYPDKISYYINVKPSGSAKNNFFQLLNHAKNKYIMFADQDDVWLKDKVKLTYETMIDAERTNRNIPILIHSDLCVVDQNLQLINPSIFQMQEMDYKRDKLNNILVSNIVTGCTMMINRNLLDLIHPQPKNAVMHDMWLALVASALGRIVFIKQPTILYRQHGDNSVGAKNTRSLGYLWSKMTGYKTVHKNLIKQYEQAEEFLDIYKAELSKQQKEMLKTYSDFNELSFYKRYQILQKFNLSKNSKTKIIGQLFF